MSTSTKYLHIQAIQSIPPGKITEPGQSRKINLDSPLSNKALQSHLRIVLYYTNADSDQEECSAIAIAAWMKETMCIALSEHPVLAGRLRRGNESDGYWEVKFNDAGVRILQASLEMKMEEFLKMEDREEKQGLLAYWMDVDLEHPEISALFYIQVTEFQGDGYSIGISCSLLLADPTFLIQFLKKWAISHNSMLAQAHPETPIFHLDYFTKTKSPNHLKSIPLNSTTNNPATNTTLFKLNHKTEIACSSVALYCIKEATRNLDTMPSSISKFSLIVNKSNGELKVESWKKEELVTSDEVFKGARSVDFLEEFGLDELVLGEGNRPMHVSCRVVSCEKEGLVIVMLPSHDDGDSEMFISVTVPNMI